MTGIYPLRTEEETWLFGRGQDDMLNIRKVKVEKMAKMKYRVFVNYDGIIKTESIVNLVIENGNYKIDYCETKFL